MMDATRVIPNLFIGSAPYPADEALSRNFDHVVLAAREYQPESRLFGQVPVLRIPFDDNPFAYPSLDEQREICKTASQVAQWVSQGRRVLVTCLAGHNRSGLIVVTALRKMYPEVSPGIAVDHLRSVRGPRALSNKKFVDLILKDYCKRFQNM